LDVGHRESLVRPGVLTSPQVLVHSARIRNDDD
jgi:hypothetical protein